MYEVYNTWHIRNLYTYILIYPTFLIFVRIEKKGKWIINYQQCEQRNIQEIDIREIVAEEFARQHMSFRLRKREQLVTDD